MQSLAVKYRPKTLNEVLGQSSVIKILKQQLETNNINNCYLFCGPSGDGKTTSARAFANAINNYQGEPIEIDAASNNGVDNMREIINNANSRAIDGRYKIFIIDEAHMLTVQAWNAMLKTIEETPEYTIFMFCTTNPEKIPATILNRVMKFNLTKVDQQLIRQRLEYICQQEGFINYNDACDYLSKICDGGVRDAIALLEKCAAYDINLDINNVLTCLGDFSYDTLFNLTGALYEADDKFLLETLEDYYNSGNDLKLFVNHYLDFTLDLVKYYLFKDMHTTKIPRHLEDRCAGFSSIPNALDFANKLTEALLDIKNAIKYDLSCRLTVEIMLLKFGRNWNNG